ncbi:MAG: PilZ domain-containing protein [Magnetococcales bacterium]|nr:PilZ domain-containing protein [Magnetococcales bacterium]
MLEVSLDSENASRYGARLVQVPSYKVEDESDDILAQLSTQLTSSVGAEEKKDEEEKEKESLSFHISPLEPSSGNLKIRRCRQVFIWFHAGRFLYDTRVIFKSIVMLDGAQAIRLSFPNILRSMSYREQHRAEIPRKVIIPMSVQKRGFKPIPAQLLDISSGGLSFACRSRKPLSLTQGDKMNLTIGGEWGPISAFGTICNMTATRDINDLQVTIQCYGLQFKMLSVADAMTVDRLVKQFTAKPEETI